MDSVEDVENVQNYVSAKMNAKQLNGSGELALVARKNVKNANVLMQM